MSDSKNDWRIKELGDVIELKRGYDLPQQNRIKGKIPIVSSSGISDFHVEAKVSGPGVVTGRYGTIGKVFYINQDFWPLNTTLYVKDFKHSFPLFISYFLRTLDFLSYSDKAAVPGINRNHLHKAIVKIPPLPTQKAIAHILGTLDDKIELNRRMNETLESIARAIFQSWFIDFDPVRAKAEGRQPEGMDATTAALFPSEFETVEGQEIPKGWIISSLDKIFNIIMGQSPPGSTYNENEEGTPFFQGRTDFGFRYPSIRVFCTAPTRFANPGDTILSLRAPVGDVNISLVYSSIGRGIAALRHTSGSRSFTYYSLKSLYEEFIQYDSNGTVFGCLTKDSFKTLTFIQPSEELIKSFEKFISPLDSKIESNVNQITSLTSLRDTLLPKLLSGELRIDNPEAFLEATA